ncbi:hypothetical protein [Jannaschia sp. M317]|uniref:hypothetical protein n=1 Tax=Jannaschia sp. M317 TaxID=2867011 RepID=UPI0021A3C8CE|nr:hypothetical protein [Jannaschia sp. M317]UWQ17099.1 hypothetical protein K3551_14565 [Jannaschia sp. M317]
MDHPQDPPYPAPMRALLILLLALTACSRPLTEAEIALTAQLHGSTLDTAPIRLTKNPTIGLFPITFDARPRTTCRERIGPPQTGRITAATGGIVLFEKLLLSPRAWLPDYARQTTDGRLDLASAMFLIHEMTHVWQWQNRAQTGYHPSRAFAEQVTIDDPYLFDEDPSRRFLDYGYEQQASLVEEYFCCAVLHPEGTRTDRLKTLLRQVLPVAEPEQITRPAIVPYEDDLPGICA